MLKDLAGEIITISLLPDLSYRGWIKRFLATVGKGGDCLLEAERYLPAVLAGNQAPILGASSVALTKQGRR